MSEGKGNCLRENVNYEIECVREGCKFVYIGETARNAYCRGREHLRGIKRKDEESVLVEHVNDQHDSDFKYDICGGYRMNVRMTNKSVFERLVTEAVRIEMSDKPTLNRKSGFRANSVLRLRSSLNA